MSDREIKLLTDADVQRFILDGPTILRRIVEPAAVPLRNGFEQRIPSPCRRP